MQLSLRFSTERTKSLLVLPPSASVKDLAVLLSKPVLRYRFSFILCFCGLTEDGIRNSARLDLIIHFLQESAWERAQSPSFFFSNAGVRSQLFLES